MGARFHISDTIQSPPFGRYEEVPGVSPGTIALFDPSLQAGAFSGVPANNGTIPNAAAAMAASILGGADPATLNFTHSMARESASALFLERSGKGGLHAIASQSIQTTGNNYARIVLPSAIRDYIFNLVSAAGDTGCLYVMAAHRLTRGQIGSPPARQFFFGANSNINISLFQNTYGQRLVAGQQGGDFQLIDTNVYASATAVTAWTGGAKPGAASSTANLMGYGGTDPIQAGTLTNKCPSTLLYYFKIEDLSKTKRTHGGSGGTFAEEYAAAWASDLARLQTYFASGGAFAGDTYTAVSGYP